MIVPEGLLERVQVAIGGQTFNGGYFSPIGLHRECRAPNAVSFPESAPQAALAGAGRTPQIQLSDAECRLENAERGGGSQTQAAVAGCGTIC